jgi:formate/nitrite transporter
VILGNLAGSLIFAWLMFSSHLWTNGSVAEHAISIAAAKCRLSFGAALIRGILCNWLVCLAVFMATSARDVTGKILACYIPITAFVASGFEHSVANMYFIPAGLLLAGELGKPVPELTWYNFFAGNLLPVTVGNIIGGVVLPSGKRAAGIPHRLENQKTSCLPRCSVVLVALQVNVHLKSELLRLAFFYGLSYGAERTG